MFSVAVVLQDSYSGYVILEVDKLICVEYSPIVDADNSAIF